MTSKPGAAPAGAEVRFGLCFFTVFSVFGVVLPYLQKLLALQGFNEKQIGFILAAGATVGVVAPPLWGWLSDHSRHRRRLLAAAGLGTLVPFLAFGWITSFWPAFAVSIVFGFFFRPIVPLADGMALRYIAEHGGDYGRMRTAGSVSFILIILFMEQLGVAGPAGRTVILGAAAVCVLALVGSVGLLPLTDREKAERASRENHQRHYDSRLFFRGPFIAFMAVAFLNRMAMVGYYGFFTLFLQREMHFQEAGYVWIVGPIAEIPVLFFSGALIRRIGVRRMIAVGCAAAAIRLIGTALAPSVLFILPLQLLHAGTFGAFYAASLHYLQRLVPRDMKQSAMAIFNGVSFGLAAIVGNAIGGIIIHHLGYRVMYASFGLIAITALAGLLAFVREPAPEAGGPRLETGGRRPEAG
jgi:PPP family 3-phenylpropionic acid transporter